MKSVTWKSDVGAIRTTEWRFLAVHCKLRHFTWQTLNFPIKAFGCVCKFFLKTKQNNNNKKIQNCASKARKGYFCTTKLVSAHAHYFDLVMQKVSRVNNNLAGVCLIQLLRFTMYFVIVISSNIIFV